MKLVKKSLLALATAAAMASPASAALNNVGGIVWDPNVPFLDFTGIGTFGQSFIFNTPPDAGSPYIGDILEGYGQITNINGGTAFCQAGPNCKLTVVFGGYELTSGEGQSTFPKTFKDGFVKFFIDTDAAADNTIAGASDGVLFLNLLARNNVLGDGNSLNVILNEGVAQGSGVLDVDISNPGLAGAAFNTNSLGGLRPAWQHGSDLGFSNTTENLVTGGLTLRGDTTEVPEPGSLALLGLGLVGLAAARRRKAA